MKYIKLYENRGDKFEIGDLVKLKTNNTSLKKLILRVSEIGNWDNYYLKTIDQQINDMGWHYDYQIRHLTKQEELEYQANKYNL
jgi:hypothetical protein